jgi:hypothetical protein
MKVHTLVLARILDTQQALFRPQIGHALRDAGVEQYRQAGVEEGVPMSHTFEKVERAPLSHDFDKVDLASIVSEDEGGCSDTEDQASADSEQTPQISHRCDDHDVWAPFKVNMGNKFYPRISLISLDSIGVALNVAVNTFDIVDTASRIMGENDDGNVDRTNAYSTCDRYRDSNSYSREESVGRLDVRLSEVFMNFVNDGDSADDEVSTINPLEWTYFETNAAFRR